MFGYRYDGYVARLDSVNDYYRFNMDLPDGERPKRTSLTPRTRLHQGQGRGAQPLRQNAVIKNAMLADGCQIDGTVENCMLFRGATVSEGATVRNSILMQGVTVGSGCSLDHVILDKGSSIRDGRSLIGYADFPIILKKNTVV